MTGKKTLQTELQPKIPPVTKPPLTCRELGCTKAREVQRSCKRKQIKTNKKKTEEERRPQKPVCGFDLRRGAGRGGRSVTGARGCADLRGTDLVTFVSRLRPTAAPERRYRGETLPRFQEPTTAKSVSRVSFKHAEISQTRGIADSGGRLPDRLRPLQTRKVTAFRPSLRQPFFFDTCAVESGV